MIDWFALFLIHALLAFVGWHLLSRDDLDINADAEEQRKVKKKKKPTRGA